MDYGHAQADKMLSEVEKRIEKEYRQAAKEVKVKLDKYLANYKKNDAEMRALLAAGKIKKKDYAEWQKKQIILTEKWTRMRDELTGVYMNADKTAMKLINDHRYDVYALNYNYGTYEVEKGARLNTGFTLYDRDTVKRLVKDNPKILPPLGKSTSEKIRRGELKKWSNKQIQSVMTQSILQGESVQEMARRIATTVSERMSYSHIRAARTMTTGVENAGRIDSYLRAEELGIKMGKTWLAVHDNHTRRSHRELDGETVPIKEPFSNDLMYPAEPTGDPAEVYNCRCTLIADVMSVDGVDLSDIGREKWNDRWDIDYEEWLKGH